MRHILKLLLFVISGLLYSQNTIDAQLLELNFLGESEPENLFTFQNEIYFTADDGIHGRELWKIENGSPKLVIDISEGSNDSFNDNCTFLVTNDFIYFTTTNGKRLWKSDGTETGTILLLSNIESEYSSFTSLIEYNSIIYFSFNDGIHGFELWKTDGTVENTIMVKDIYEGSTGSEILDFFVFNNHLYFTAIDGDAANRRELWKTDGTDTGTILLKDLGGSTLYDGVKAGNDFLILDNEFFFYGFSPGHWYELWKSDGTEEGTQMVKDINSGNAYNESTLLGAVGNNHIVFRAYTSNSGYELWRSDGTEDGTYKVKEINVNDGSYGDGIPSGNHFHSYNGKVYFTATEGVFYKLWVTDGTEEGTEQFLNLDLEQSEYYGDFKIANNKLYFLDNKRVVRTDGTSSEVFVNMENEGGISQYQPIQDKVYFVKNFDEINGLEIWESEINNQNLKVLEINSTNGSSPRNFANLGDKVVFFGRNHNNYENLMITDGSPEGTKSILDDPPFRVDHNNAARLFQVGDDIFFRAAVGPQANTGLYKTNGTPEGTILVKSSDINTSWFMGEPYANYNGILYFVGGDNFYGSELYRSDGTEEGTYMVKNLSDGDYEGNPFNTYINSFAQKDGFLYFSGQSDELGGGEVHGVWRTNGTDEGTELMIEFPYVEFSYNDVFILSAINDKIFIYKNLQYGDYQLYVSDGTQENLVLLKTFQGNSQGGIVITETANYDGKFYFVQNRNLYVSDGTIQGTRLVNDNLEFSSVSDLIVCGDYLYFREIEDNFSNLWRTDGTASGTIKIVSGSNSAHGYFDHLTCFNSNLLFAQGWSNIIYSTKGELDDLVSAEIITNDNYNFGDYEGINSLFINQDKLYLIINTHKYGKELYVASPEFLLSSDEINDGLKNEKSKIQIYPNPTSSEINVVSTDQSKIQQIQLYDLTGKLMELGMYNSNEVKLNLSKYNAGIYLVKVKTEKSTSTQKVIVK